MIFSSWCASCLADLGLKVEYPIRYTSLSNILWRACQEDWMWLKLTMCSLTSTLDLSSKLIVFDESRLCSVGNNKSSILKLCSSHTWILALLALLLVRLLLLYLHHWDSVVEHPIRQTTITSDLCNSAHFQLLGGWFLKFVHSVTSMSPQRAYCNTPSQSDLIYLVHKQLYYFL